jgi:hypothetical protein
MQRSGGNVPTAVQRGRALMDRHGHRRGRRQGKMMALYRVVGRVR